MKFNIFSYFLIWEKALFIIQHKYMRIAFLLIFSLWYLENKQHMYTHRHIYLYATIKIKEKEAFNLRVRGTE